MGRLVKYRWWWWWLYWWWLGGGGGEEGEAEGGEGGWLYSPCNGMWFA